MKNIIIFLILFSCISIIPNQTRAQVKVYSDGNVKFCEKSDYNGIKIWRTNPSDYVVRIKGQWNNNLTIGESGNMCDYIYVTNLRYNNMLNLSDKRLKKNIKPLNGILDSLLQLEPVKFDYIPFQSEKMTSKENEKSIKNSKNKYGFVAQDVQKIFPHLVVEEDDGMYAINMNGLIALCVESIQEQQKTIEELEARIKTFEDDCCKNYSSKSAILNSLETNTNKAKLYQNAPNPFSHQTNIKFEVPETVGNAQLHICNMLGTLLKTISILQRGTGHEMIHGSEFMAGMYLYSLVIDGKIVDTKQMLLTE